MRKRIKNKGTRRRFQICKIFSRKIVLLFWLIIVLEAFCIDYFLHCEEFFSFSAGNLVAVIVVIWTFTLSVCTLLSQEIDKKYFGVRLIHLVKKAQEQKIITGFVFIYLISDIVILIIATVLDLKLLLLVDVGLQLFTMSWIALFAFTYVTRENVLKQVKREIQEVDLLGDDNEVVNDRGINLMFYNFLQCFLSSDECEYATVLCCLVERVPQNKRCLYCDLKYVYRSTCRIMYFICMRCMDSGNKQKVEGVLVAWYRKAAWQEMKSGILSGLIDIGELWAFKLCLKLIAIECNRQEARQKAIFLLVRNLYLQDVMKQEWRDEYTRVIKGRFFLVISSKEQRTMIDLLDHMYANQYPDELLRDAIGDCPREPLHQLLFQVIF